MTDRFCRANVLTKQSSVYVFKCVTNIDATLAVMSVLPTAPPNK